MLIIFFIFLIFFSKVSFHFVSGVPYQIFPVVFQYGLHPYINILLCCALGLLFFIRRRYRLQTEKQLKIYNFFLLLFSSYLFLITVTQILFSANSESPLMNMTACGLSIFTIYLFGKWVPTHFSKEIYFKYLKNFSYIFSWVSLVLLIVSPGTSFMGGRFIGVFKHIPHMVSIATFCSVFSLYDIFSQNFKTRVQLGLGYAHFILGVYLLILTGTRSALASVFMSAVLALIVFKTQNVAVRFLKTAIAMSMLLVGILFGADLADYATQVVRGERAIGLRAAQDGVSARWDEIVRGYSLFQEQPWMGYGLLNKFGQNEDGSVGAYDANKDPHNLLISAGVTGGYIMVIIVGLGFFGLTLLTLSRLRSKDEVIKILAIYMLTQIPVIFIYHLHLSMGGIADRIYWLTIGYLAIAPGKKTEKMVKNQNESKHLHP